jgi:hypothetical protein
MKPLSVAEPKELVNDTNRVKIPYALKRGVNRESRIQNRESV